jgi:hypothetical protein
MPPQLAASFTTSELAVLRIITDEVREHGQCDRTLGEIAARAGVCRATAQNALRHAARLGLLTIEERRRSGRPSLPNVIRMGLSQISGVHGSLGMAADFVASDSEVAHDPECDCREAEAAL